MELCELCTEITQWLAELDSGDGSQYTTWVMRASPKSSEMMCPFCKIWLSKVQRDWQWHYLMLRRFYLRIDFWCFYPSPGSFPYDPGDYYSPPCPYQHSIRGRVTQIDIPDDYWGDQWNGSRQAWLGVTTWTDDGDASKDDAYPLRRILSPRFEYLCSITRKWLNECISQHSLCPRWSEVELPTRVLEIKQGSSIFDTPSVRLVESGGGTGKYCALSHCWGSSPDKKPLRTTSYNLAQNLVDIPFDSLPVTFQDTVLFARGVGIFHVWIDSLCIVQDDERDWHQQAEQMGRIYHNASLVVLASGAKDSSEGLYFREVPFVFSRESHSSSYKAWARRSRPFDAALYPTWEAPAPQDGPLYKRAWTYQERLLARRSVFFLQGRLAFRCAEDQRDDRESCDLALYDEISWHSLLRAYTRQLLTFESDRLHALRGIVEDTRATTQDHFYHEYGVWKTTLYKDLLWRRGFSSTLGIQTGLPSWAWPAISGDKTWCPDMYSREVEPKSVLKSLELTDHGSLAIKGYLAEPLELLNPELEIEWLVALHDFRELSHPEGAVVLDKYAYTYSLPSYIIWKNDDKERLMGIAVFDTEPPYASARCCILAYSERIGYSRRSENSPSQSCQSESIEDVSEDEYFPDADCESFGVYGDYTHLNDRTPETWPSIVNVETSRSRNPRDYEPLLGDRDGHGDEMDDVSENEMDDIDMDEVCIEPEEIERRFSRLKQVTSFVYWALLLKPVGDGKSERIGLAMLYPHAPDALGAKLTDLEII